MFILETKTRFKTYFLASLGETEEKFDLNLILK